MRRLQVHVLFLFLFITSSAIAAFSQEHSNNEVFPVPVPQILHNFGLLPQQNVEKAVATSSTPAAAYTIPATNQTNCYNTTSIMICPVPSASFFGQDASYDKAPLSLTTMSLGESGSVVMDSLSRFWSAPDTARTYSEADAYCAAKAAILGNSWRLPTLKELSQLVNVAKTSPAVDTDFFPSMQSANYWTSDTQSDANSWIVNFAAGATQALQKTSTAATICVSSMGQYSGQFVANEEDTVTDTRTSSMWQRADSTSPMTWQNALAQCEQSTTGGYTDWRLPSKNELQSIIDPTASSLWPSVFTSHAAAYWTATTLNGTPSSAWVVLSDKQSNAAAKTGTQYVRCVRNMAPQPVDSHQLLMSGTWTATVAGAAITTKIVNSPRYVVTSMNGQTYEFTLGAVSGESTVAASPSYSYHYTGLVQTVSSGDNTMLSHADSAGANYFTGISNITSATGSILDASMGTLAAVTTTRTAKASTQSDFDLSGLWAGTALGTSATADLRSATYTSGGQTVAYFNGSLSVPYGNMISGYTFTGFMDSDGSVFMIRNATTAVYIFEGTRTGDTITGSLRNYDEVLATGIVFTRIAKTTPLPAAAMPPYLLLLE